MDLPHVSRYRKLRIPTGSSESGHTSKTRGKGEYPRPSGQKSPHPAIPFRPLFDAIRIRRNLMSPSVQAIRRFLEAHDRFAAHNGITVEDADYDYGKVSLAFEDHAKNSLDMLHGGALFTLADMAFGLASNFGQEDGTMISTNATISYMKSAKTGPIVAEARLANGGRHLATYEVKIYDGQGTYIACAMISGYRLDTKLAIEE